MIERSDHHLQADDPSSRLYPTLGSWLLNVIALSELGIGKHGIVEGLDLPGEVQHHLMHMGFVPDARVLALRRAPPGDPTVYAIDGMEIALRHETARSIHVRIIPDNEEQEGSEDFLLRHRSAAGRQGKP